MTRLIDRPEHDGARFTGTYLIGGIRHSTNSEILVLDLTDHSATAEALYLPTTDAPPLQLWQQVSCGMSVDRNRHFRRFLKLDNLTPGPMETSLELLPNCACPVPESLRRLVDTLESAITHPPLRQFIDRAFAELELGLLFLRIPASYSCHHTETGGLLRHTVDLVETLAFNLRDYPCEAQRQCAIIAGLFHDLGKLGNQLLGPTPFRGRDHAELNIMLLQDALAQLRQSCIKSWKLMHFMLSALNGRICTDTVPAAALVQMLDRYSASTSAMQNAFAGQPEGQLTASIGYHPHYPTRHFERSELPQN